MIYANKNETVFYLTTAILGDSVKKFRENQRELF